MTQGLLPEIFERPFRQIPSIWSNLSYGWPSFFEEDIFAQNFAARGARIYEEGNELHVEVPLAGLEISQIKVSLNQGVLFVNGEAREEEKDKKRKFYRSSKRSYSYSIALPTQIDEKQEPQAEFENGILNISLKLAKGQGEAKTITVKEKKKKA